MEELITYKVSEADARRRIDVLLSSYCEVNSRSLAQRLLKKGMAEVNGQPVSPSYKVRLGDCIRFSLMKPEPLDVVPESGELDILFEDANLIVINKAAGMVVHPAPGHDSGTLVNLLLHHCPDLSGIGGKLRPGIVHRLDKDTTGVLVVAKTDVAHTNLSRQFQEHTIHRVYEALIYGDPLQDRGTIESAIGRHPKNRKKKAIVINGKPATTHWKVIARYPPFAHLECRLETGRTHQIRVHLSSQNMPIWGDPQYGRNPIRHTRLQSSKLQTILLQCGRLALHARELGFIHPVTGEHQHFTSPIPFDMDALIQALAEQKTR